MLAVAGRHVDVVLGGDTSTGQLLKSDFSDKDPKLTFVTGNPTLCPGILRQINLTYCSDEQVANSYQRLNHAQQDNVRVGPSQITWAEMSIW